MEAPWYNNHEEQEELYICPLVDECKIKDNISSTYGSRCPHSVPHKLNGIIDAEGIVVPCDGEFETCNPGGEGTPDIVMPPCKRVQ